MSLACSITSFCRPLNLGWEASGARPRITASEVVKNTPTYIRGRFMKEGFNIQIVKPVSVSEVQIFCLLENAKKHSQQECEPVWKASISLIQFNSFFINFLK